MCQDDRPSVAVGPSGEAALGTVSLLSVVTSLLSMNRCVVNCRQTGFDSSEHSERCAIKFHLKVLQITPDLLSREVVIPSRMGE